MGSLGRAAQAGRDLLLEEEDARAQTTSRITVEKLSDDYIRRGIAKLRSRRVIEVCLRRALRTLLSRAAADITKRDIRDLLDAVSDRGRNAEADSQRQVIGALFSFGVRRDHIQTNPTTALDKYHTLVPRDRVLPPEEVKLFREWVANGLLCSRTMPRFYAGSCASAPGSARSLAEPEQPNSLDDGLPGG